jgi:SnoaL-like domain
MVDPGPHALSSGEIADIVEIEQLLARYAVAMTKLDLDMVRTVFTEDGTYSAFGDTYTVDEFPALAQAAPRGLFMTGTPLLDFDGDTATGTQPLCFVSQLDHYQRVGYWTDTFVRTEGGWRLRTRSMTFLRRSGAADSGIPHNPLRPIPASAER